MPDPVNAGRRQRRSGAHKRILAHRKAIGKLNAYIAKLNRAIRKRDDQLAGGPGAKAAHWLLSMAGRTESPAGSNDSPFLAQWRKDIPSLAWIKGQPWCGFAVRVAYHLAGKELPDGVVYTPNIVAWAKAGKGFDAIPPTAAKVGDLVVFDWQPGTGADHVGLALGPAVGGMITCVEGNTSPSNAGSQSNGGGIFKRTRPVGFIAVVARPK